MEGKSGRYTWWIGHTNTVHNLQWRKTKAGGKKVEGGIILEGVQGYILDVKFGQELKDELVRRGFLGETSKWRKQ